MSVAVPRSPSRATFAHARRQSSSIPPRSLPPSYTVVPPPPVPALPYRAPAPAYAAHDAAPERFAKADRTRNWINQQTTPHVPESALQSYGYAPEFVGAQPTACATPPESPTAADASFSSYGYAFAMSSNGSRPHTQSESKSEPMPSGFLGNALARSMGGSEGNPKRSKSAVAAAPKGKGMLRFLGRKDDAHSGNGSSFMDMSRH
jgi:hypothetical protein